MYQRVLELALAAPWAIQPEYALIVQSVLAERVAGAVVAETEIAARLAAAAPASRSSTGAQASVAVLPIVGVISHRMELLTQVSARGTSPHLLAERFRAALQDPGVHSLVLDIDSPGGSVFGLDELATEIRAARGRKPIIAVANAIAASAAYWIAAQADELVVTPTGQVGSIGVYSMHENIRELLAKEGREITLVAYGEYKTEGNPFEPLTEEAKGAAKAEVEAYGEMFVKAVARGRGVPVDTVRASFGKGRMVLAKDAVERGMADRVATFDEVVLDLERRQAARRRGAESAAQAAHFVRLRRDGDAA